MYIKKNRDVLLNKKKKTINSICLLCSVLLKLNYLICKCECD